MAGKVKKELHFGGLEDKISGFSYFIVGKFQIRVGKKLCGVVLTVACL